MSRLFVALTLLATLLLACSGAPAATQPPGATATPGAEPPAGQPTQPPAGQPTQPPAGGDLETLVRGLVPPGATETGEFSAGGAYQLYLTSSMTPDQLEAFWDQKIPSLGMTLTGKFTSQGVLTIAITNPDGGIVVTPNEEGGVSIVISLGLSS